MLSCGRMTERDPVAEAEQFDLEQEGWKQRALTSLLWWASAALLATLVFAQYGGLGDHRTTAILALGAVFCIGLAWLSSLSFAFRARLFLLAVGGVCALMLAFAGYVANAFIGFAIVLSMATLLLGRRAGLVSVILLTLSIVGVSALHRAGLVERMPNWAEWIDTTRPETAARVAIVFALGSTAMVVGISYLLGRAEALWRERMRSLERVARDALEKEQLRNQLLVQEAAVRKAQELEILGRLSGSVAHDFNNALLMIFFSLDELVALGNLSPPITEALADIRTAANQAATTTRQLRAFGAQAPGPVSSISVASVVERAVPLLRRVLPRNIELELALAASDSISADEGQVQRVLVNLVLNARDAMPEGGTLTLRTERAANEAGSDGERLVLGVEDTGAGMSDEVKARLFEPFFTTKGAAGTGLGLSGVRALVDAQGGTVSVQSELGRGTRLSVSWPIVDGDVKLPTPGAPELAAGAGISALYVEDDPGVQRAMARALRRRGFGVLEACDAQEGLLLARRYRDPIQVLCSDCLMPGPPIAQLIAGFRDAHPEGRIVICSGYAPEQAAVSFEQVDAFLPKPFSPDAMAETLVNVVRRGGAGTPESA